jgi:hypothetical protein
MASKHPWMQMRHGLQDYRRRLAAAGQPDHRDNDRPAVDAEHDKRRHLDRGRHVERELGEVERADDRNQEDQSDREDNRE